MIKQFSGYGYEGEMEHTINGLNPGTDYDLYILPLDADGNNGKLQVTKCKTKAMGGEGKSVMTITVKDDFIHSERPDQPPPRHGSGQGYVPGQERLLEG